MYQDWRQWARLVYSGFLLFVVWNLSQPWAVESYQEWGIVAGWVQVSLFTISAGFLFPKTKRLEPMREDGSLSSDALQLGAGLVLNAIAWTMTVF